jgi:hypothetical protein
MYKVLYRKWRPKTFDEVIGDYWSRISWAELAVDKKFFDVDYEIEDLASDYDSEGVAKDWNDELED